MIDNKKLLGNDNDIFQIKEVLEKSLDNKWTQEFVYLLRKFFYIEYWSNVEKNERYTIQMIQEILKKHLDFLDEDRRTEEVLRKFRAMLPYLQQLVISDMKAAYDIKKRMEKLRMKVVIMYGGNELFAAKSVSLVKEKCVSECEVYAYDNMGHSEVLSLHPEKLCEIIRK